jgi:hypothetical protein
MRITHNKYERCVWINNHWHHRPRKCRLLWDLKINLPRKKTWSLRSVLLIEKCFYRATVRCFRYPEIRSKKFSRTHVGCHKILLCFILVLLETVSIKSCARKTWTDVRRLECHLWANVRNRGLLCSIHAMVHKCKHAISVVSIRISNSTRLELSRCCWLGGKPCYRKQRLARCSAKMVSVTIQEARIQHCVGS